jgi:hypothetical protein
MMVATTGGPNSRIAERVYRHARHPANNAHTTASDALWTGLPLVTCRGETLAGRVAASLLMAVDLPELITTSLEDHEALAFRLALPALRHGAFTRHIEAGCDACGGRMRTRAGRRRLRSRRSW